ncbi:uncharacterized protein A1O9_07176 [Exophiala aquamarina CBS 119918]|uniref:Uncharacterized protein n=1 Tax=Exophiala aquamarina CBS 119918 TaxID=1182545 RepID=A0A072PAT2_9EURO|nr:uncharacterized protein A1O9_07176 [Exophiala aquamarina CBS 119918]KEF56986.1 hypothetical protein A1O9_07176 [Exophiala aquamarina CBS 119918]
MATSTTTTTTTKTAGGGKETFTLLLFATAASYTDTESLSLPGPTTLGDVFQTLETRFPGFLRKILAGAAVTLNLEYVDVGFPQGEADSESELESQAEAMAWPWAEWKSTLEGWGTAVKIGDEVGVIPPVSSG